MAARPGRQTGLQLFRGLKNNPRLAKNSCEASNTSLLLTPILPVTNALGRHPADEVGQGVALLSGQCDAFV